MDGADLAKRDHQRNKSEIVNLVKDMFRQDKWGYDECRIRLQELAAKDEDLVRDVMSKIRQEKGL